MSKPKPPCHRDAALVKDLIRQRDAAREQVRRLVAALYGAVEVHPDLKEMSLIAHALGLGSAEVCPICVDPEPPVEPSFAERVYVEAHRQDREGPEAVDIS